MSTDTEPKVKLSASNIFSLVAILITVGGGFLGLYSKIVEQNQRVTMLEKAVEENKSDKGKVDFKLDKIIESVNQIKVDMAKNNLKTN